MIGRDFLDLGGIKPKSGLAMFEGRPTFAVANDERYLGNTETFHADIVFYARSCRLQRQVGLILNARWHEDLQIDVVLMKDLLVLIRQLPANIME